MSTDGTQPPSFAPRTAPARTSVRTKDDESRPAERTSGETVERPVERPEPGENRSSGGESVGDRMKRATQGVIGTTTDRGSDVPRPGTARGPRETTETSSASTGPAATGPRKVRLAVARIDPWSVMKLSFLLSFAIGIMIVVAAAVVWMTLDGLGVFTSVNDTIAEITGSADFFNLLEYVSFSRILSLATLIAIVDVVLLTALSTIGAFLYNIVAALVGGIHLTLTDD